MGRFDESRHIIGHVELGVFSGIFKSADFEKHIVGSLRHVFRVFFGCNGHKLVDFYR